MTDGYEPIGMECLKSRGLAYIQDPIWTWVIVDMAYTKNLRNSWFKNYCKTHIKINSWQKPTDKQQQVSDFHAKRSKTGIPQQRRSEYMLTMPYRTYHKLVDIPYSDYLIWSILSHMTFVLTSKNTLPKVFIFPNTIGQWSPYHDV